ncbi:FxsA family protein [Halomonas sp. YLGW01]|uniref:FxsA family protein n=1 Tax=Halomonas sp. YLGW01 TaxID=2773308 RepID=UPI0017839B13|nr:FxsA family protein [Halomonas sp. YLGW01]
MPLLLLFTLFALLDFVILFSIGSEIGLLTTLLLVIGSGFVGLHLIRREGTATLARAQQRFAQGEIPSGELMTGAALIFGGALLMAPGFLSDGLGLMCLIPDARRLLGKLLARVGLKARVFGGTSGAGPSGPSFDGWEEASGAKREERHDDAASQHSSDQAPLEGEFISRDEPHR